MVVPAPSVDGPLRDGDPRGGAGQPHLIVYDAAILILPLMWFGSEVLEQATADDARRYATLVYGLFLAFFIPTAAFVPVQISVLLMLWLFWNPGAFYVANRPARGLL
jgi:hypothetical protein